MSSANVYNEPVHDSEDWYDDVGQNLDTFVRLSKAGQFRRANQYYRDVLERYSDQIAVVASYADSLIDQGAFQHAESLLLHSLEQYPRSARGGDNDIKAIDIQDDESLVLKLLLAIARLYTHCDWKQAHVLVEQVQNTSQMLSIDSEIPPLQLQIVILNLRLTDLLLRMSEHNQTLDITVKLEIPFRAQATSSSRLSWTESIITLLEHDYPWEAHALYTMMLRYPTLQTQIPFERIIRSIPQDYDSMYTLITLTMLAGALLSSQMPLQSLSSALEHLDLFDDWQNIICYDVTRLMRPIEGVESDITDSRAFALALLACLTTLYLENHRGREVAPLCPLVESKWLPGGSRSWTAINGMTVVGSMQSVAAEHEDYMFSLAICEATGLVLPEGWLEKTGASGLAIRSLHHKAKLEQSVPSPKASTEQGNLPRTEQSSLFHADRPLRTPSHSENDVVHVLGGANLPALFESCMRTFEYVDLGTKYGSEIQKSALKILVLELRLSRWSQRIRFSETEESGEIGATTGQSSLIKKVLGQIQDDLEAVGKPSRRYVLSQPATGSARLMELGTRIRKLSLERRQRRTSVTSKTLWALKNKRWLDNLIEDLTMSINSLEHVFPDTRSSPWQRQALIEDAERLVQPLQGTELDDYVESLISVLAEITEDVDDQLREALGNVAIKAMTGDAYRNAFTTHAGRSLKMDRRIFSSEAERIPTDESD